MLTKEFYTRFIKPSSLEKFDDFYAILALSNITEKEFLETQEFLNSFGLSMTNLSHLKLCKYDKEVIKKKIDFAKQNNKYNDLLKSLLNILYVDCNVKKKDLNIDLNAPVVEEITAVEVINDMNNVMPFQSFDQIDELLSTPQNNTFTDEHIRLYGECDVKKRELVNLLNLEKVTKSAYMIESSIAKLISEGFVDMKEIISRSIKFSGNYSEPLTNEELSLIDEKVDELFNSNVRAA